jgi:hypothetical protein
VLECPAPARKHRSSPARRAFVAPRRSFRCFPKAPSAKRTRLLMALGWTQQGIRERMPSRPTPAVLMPRTPRTPRTPSASRLRAAYVPLGVPPRCVSCEVHDFLQGPSAWGHTRTGSMLRILWLWLTTPKNAAGLTLEAWTRLLAEYPDAPRGDPRARSMWEASVRPVDAARLMASRRAPDSRPASARPDLQCGRRRSR